jgi:tetratricopeptide (TPR) repeat protein
LARASLKHDLRDYKGAINDYDQVILLQRDQVETYNDRGCCKYNLGDYQGAYEDFTRRLSSNPTAVIFYNRASSSLKLGDTIRALADTMSGYALDAKKLNDSSYQEIKDLLNRTKPFALLGAWMVSNWERNAALRNAATWHKGMSHTPIPPATNLSVPSCIALIGAWMSTNWKMNAALKRATLSQNSVPNPFTDKLKILWKKSKSNLLLTSSNTILTRTQTQRVTIALGALLALGVGCAALIRYDDHLRLADEKSLLSDVQKLYNSGDYLQCIRKAGDIRSRLRERLRVEASDLRSSCLSGQHTKVLAAITDESSVKSIQAYRQLLEDLRHVANEGYSDNDLQEKIRAARETLKDKMRSYADHLYETSQQINDVVLIYQLLGDYPKAQILRSEWQRDEQVFNEALSNLKKLDPSQHNPFEMPRFNTAYWNNLFQQRSPRVLIERAINAAKYYRERGEWEQCEQAAKEALRMGEQINDNSMAASANWYWEQCLLGAKDHGGSSRD